MSDGVRQSAAESPSELVARLNAGITEVLRPLVDVNQPVALLDFPSFPNVGDSCIWLGTLRCLRTLGVERFCYTADSRTYTRDHLASVIGDGTILISGGGNLGDLWPVHQPFREEVLAAFPRNRIVQLPQSIYFREPAALTRAREVFDRHPDLHLLVRDDRSLAIAREEFRAPSLLCPDMAFALGPMERPTSAVKPVVWLARRDHESLPHHLPGQAAGVERVDWPRDGGDPLVLLNRLARALPFERRALRPLRDPLSRLYEPLAARRVARACRILSAAHRVVTDRLHAHILCLLLGIPHALLDNSYGKIRAVFDTCTHDSDLVQWCNDAGEAQAWTKQVTI